MNKLQKTRAIEIALMITLVGCDAGPSVNMFTSNGVSSAESESESESENQSSSEINCTEVFQAAEGFFDSSEYAEDGSLVSPQFMYIDIGGSLHTYVDQTTVQGQAPLNCYTGGLIGGVNDAIDKKIVHPTRDADGGCAAYVDLSESTRLRFRFEPEDGLVGIATTDKVQEPADINHSKYLDSWNGEGAEDTSVSYSLTIEKLDTPTVADMIAQRCDPIPEGYNSVWTTL